MSFEETGKAKKTKQNTSETQRDNPCEDKAKVGAM